MKKDLSIIMTAFVSVLAPLVISCADVEFDNPLDPSGANYLWGEEVTEEVEKDMISEGKDGPARLFTNPEYACDRQPPAITLLGDETAEIIFGDTAGIAEFKRYMGLYEEHWQSAVSADRGAMNTPVSVRISLSTDSVKIVTPKYDGEMPNPGTYYIRYIAEKPTCGTGKDAVTPTSEPVIRELLITPPVLP